MPNTTARTSTLLAASAVLAVCNAIVRPPSMVALNAVLVAVNHHHLVMAGRGQPMPSPATSAREKLVDVA